ncbi:MAG: TIGR00268 family protein, partial [Candidatus Hydrothermarchaeota archaeon]|nr:TIGR00268 family protein [Candidatus Hydrothermarchaeota archaeon]
ITKEKLRKIEEAEDFIRKLGFEQVRVRYHGSMARIEISEKDISKVLKFRKKILKKLKNNFAYVALDLEGYRSGSMDEVLR